MSTAATAARRHQRLRAARQRDQRIGADVERLLETLAGRLEEAARDFVAPRERRAVHDEVEPAVLRLNPREHRGDLVIVLNVARQHQRTRRQGLRQFRDVFLEAALVGEDELRAQRMRWPGRWPTTGSDGWRRRR